MADKPRQPQSWHRVTAGYVLVNAALMCAFWVLLVGGVHRDEMIVGCGCVIAATAMLWLIARVTNLRFRFTAEDISSGLLVPWHVVKDTYIVTRVLLRDVFLGKRPSPVFLVNGFKTSKRDPRDVARRVLVVAYSSASPNSIVLGVDYAQSRILFHQLEQTELDDTMLELGARP